MLISIRNYRRLSRADIAVDPIALVAGRNGSGKTSIVQAAQAALLRRAVVVPGGTVKAAAAFVHRGADAGTVTVVVGHDRVSVAWPKCKVEEVGAAPRCSEIAAGVVSIMDLKPAERAEALRPYADATPTRADLAAAMSDVGYSADAIEKLWGKIRAESWDAAHKAATDLGTKLKGQWEQTTGEAFGAVKAASWRPQGWTEELDGADHGDLQMAAAEAEDVVHKAVKAGALGEAEIAALNDQVEAGQHVDVDARREAVADALKALDAAKAARAALPPAEEAALPCPHCGNGLVVDVPYRGDPTIKAAAVEAIGPAETKKRRQAIAEADGTVERLARDHVAGVNALSTAERIVSDAEVASRRLMWLDGAAISNNTVDDAKKARDAAMNRLRMWERRAAAAQTYATWARNDKLIDALSPAGLRKTALTKALADLNRTIEAVSAFAGWGAVRIDEALDVHLGAEPYWLLSESMQWRIRVTLQVALAAIEKASLVVIDRADVLDAAGRNGLFAMLIETGVPALVAMTANKAEAVPNLGKMGVGQSYWIKDGVALDLSEAREQAA